MVGFPRILPGCLDVPWFPPGSPPLDLPGLARLAHLAGLAHGAVLSQSDGHPNLRVGHRDPARLDQVLAAAEPLDSGGVTRGSQG